MKLLIYSLDIIEETQVQSPNSESFPEYPYSEESMNIKCMGVNAGFALAH